MTQETSTRKRKFSCKGIDYSELEKYIKDKDNIYRISLFDGNAISWFDVDNKLLILGSGAYSEVYKYKKGDDFVAVKRYMQLEYDVEEDHLTEIWLLHTLNHSNIIKAIDAFYTCRGLNLVLPVGTCNLYNRIKNKSKLSTKKNKQIMKQLFNGIQYLHSNKILHGDLKTSNVLVMQEDDESIHICIIDLDSILIDEEGKGVELDHTAFTLNYRAPEIVFCRFYHRNSDIWALGCILIEMISGKVAFEYIDSEYDLMYKFFRIFGTPHVDTWSCPQPLKNWEMTWPQYDAKGIREWFKLDEKEMRMIEKMLTLDYTKRDDIENLLNHEWMKLE